MHTKLRPQDSFFISLRIDTILSHWPWKMEAGKASINVVSGFGLNTRFTKCPNEQVPVEVTASADLYFLIFLLTRYLILFSQFSRLYKSNNWEGLGTNFTVYIE